MIVLLGPILTGRAVQSDSDILFYYYPVKSAIRALWLGHQSLAWNPLLGEGQPLASNPEHALFYPLTWLIFLLPVARALAIAQVVHLILMFLGVRRMLRRLPCSDLGALFGAVTWTFGGLMISSMHYFPIFYSWAWIPWLCAELFSPRPSVIWTAVVAGLIICIGEPVSAAMALLASAAILFSRRRPGFRIRTAAIAAILAALLSAASLIPGIAVAGKSVRAAGLPDATSYQESFPSARFVELLAPRAFGTTVPHRDANYLGWRLYPERMWPFFTGIYSGAALIPLFIAGALSGGRRTRALMPVIVLAVLLALGRKGVVLELLRRSFPLARGFRFPEKFLLLAMLFAVVLASRGFDAIRRSPTGARRAGAVFLAAGAVFGAAAVLPIVAPGTLFDPARLFARLPIEDAALFYRSVFFRAAMIDIGYGSLFFMLARPRDRRHRFFLGAAVVVLAAVDTASASRDFIRTRSIAEIEAAPPIVGRILRRRPVARLVDLLPDDPPVRVPGAEVFNGPWDRNRLSPDQAIQWGIPLALDVDYDLTYMASSTRARRLLALVASRDVLRFSRLLAGRGAGALLVWNRPVTLSEPVAAFAIPGVRPEVDSPAMRVPFHGDEEFLAIVQNWSGDLAQVAFVEGPSPASPEVLPQASLTVTLASTTTLSFSATCPSRCLVRVARTNDGNWNARIDGRPESVETVDLSLIGIQIPPGRHSVNLNYHDPRLSAGIGISVATGIGLVAAGLVRRVKRRRRGAGGQSADP